MASIFMFVVSGTDEECTTYTIVGPHEFQIKLNHFADLPPFSGPVSMRVR